MKFMKLFRMQKLMLAKYSLIFFSFLFFLLISNFVSANDFVIIKGNKNISEKTIQSFAPKEINTFNPELINTFQKDLFATGFFENVKITLSDNKLIIEVIENPLINFFFIEGLTNDNKKISDEINNIVKSKENTILQTYLIKEDIKNISNFLKNLGYLENKINYQLVKINDEKVNLFYNIDLQNKFKTKRIFFIGNKFFKSSTLKDVVLSEEYGWWKFLSNFTIPSESIINYDISNLKKFFLDNGFYDVQISSHSIKVLDNEYANIIYSINSGNKYIIDDIDFIDSLNLINDETLTFLKKKYKNLIKNTYNASELEKYLNFSTEYLNKSNLNLVFRHKLDKIDNTKLKLSFLVFDQKNKKLVNKITIKGNNITDDFVIRNSLNISEGDLLNSNKLNTSVDKIKDTGIFRKVNAEIVNDNNETVDIEIRVEEQATGELSAGAGAGSSGATIQAAINEKNFLGKGLNLNSSLILGTQKVRGLISYYDPDYKNSGNGLKGSFFIEGNNYENSDYENTVVGSSFSTLYEIYDKVFFKPGISIDHDSVTIGSNASTALKKRAGNYYTSKIFYELVKNTKNREIQTTDGYTFGFGQDLSLISDIQYINNSIFGSYFKEYKENFVGSVKTKIETINGFNDDIKYSDRLFVSSDNLRGFSQRGIGPKIDNEFIGGNYSFYTSFSSTIPNGLPDKWNAITNVFLDAANVWGVDDNSTDDSNKLRSSIGVGISWISPIGPIGFSYAEPISKKSTDDIEQFNFKIGSVF